jgi:hypothetical protein
MRYGIAHVEVTGAWQLWTVRGQTLWLNSSCSWTFTPLKMGPIRSPKTSARNQPTLCNIPDEDRIQVNRCKSLRSRKHDILLQNSAFMCFLWFPQTAISNLNSIKWLVFETESECLLWGRKWILLSLFKVVPGLGRTPDHSTSDVWQTDGLLAVLSYHSICITKATPKRRTNGKTGAPSKKSEIGQSPFIF